MPPFPLLSLTLPLGSLPTVPLIRFSLYVTKLIYNLSSKNLITLSLLSSRWSNDMPNRTRLMAKFNLEPETSLSHVWVTVITTSEASMAGINFPSDQPSRLIFLKYIINHPYSKILQALPIVHEAKAKCIVVSSEVLWNWSPPGSQPHCIPFLLGLQWTSALSYLGQPPLQSCKLTTSLRTWFNYGKK